MHKKTDTFIKLPEYPGGKEQFKDFILKNLRYPKEAYENKIEGMVILNAEITDRGIVQDVRIEKGLGYGCDEEAVRVLSLVKFGGVTNRGVRVKARKTFKIRFSLPKENAQTISYSLKEPVAPISKVAQQTYSYTVFLSPDKGQ